MALRFQEPGIWLGGNSFIVSKNFAAIAWIGMITNA